MKKPICVVVGVGPGNGAALAKRFAEEGYSLALLARSVDFSTELAARIGNAHPYQCDVTNVVSVNETFAKIRKEMGEVDVLIYNAGSGVWGNVEEITLEQFEAAWRINALGLLATSQQVIPNMKK